MMRPIRLADEPAQLTLPRYAGGQHFTLGQEADGSVTVRHGDNGSRRLTPAGVVISGWTPTRNGKGVIYATTTDGDRDHRFFVADLDGASEPLPEFKTRRPVPVPVDDGFWIVADTYSEPAPADPTRPPHSRPVFVPLPGSARAGGGIRVLADDQIRGARSLAVSPDGERLAVLTRTPIQESVWLAPATPETTSHSKPRLIARTQPGGISTVTFSPDGRPCLISTVRHRSAEVLLGTDRDATGWQPLPRSDADGPLPETDQVVNACWTRDPTGPPIAVVHLQRDGASRLVGYSVEGQPLGPSFTLGPAPGALLELAADDDGDGDEPHRLAAVWSAPLHPPRIHTISPRQLARRSTSSRVRRRPRRQPLSTTTATSFRASDGVDIPVTVSHPAGGPHGPTVLTCYGGFGLTLPPAYSAAVAAWVAAGGSWVAVGARGGGERGTDWHEAGRGRNKPRTVVDLADAVQWATRVGYATPGRIGLYGSSHGGLIAAAVAARVPSRYAALVVSAPLVDVRRFHRSWPGRSWVGELGDPDNELDAAALRSIDPLLISPDVSGPAVLVSVGALDQRVPPEHGKALAAAWASWGHQPDGTRRCPPPTLVERIDIGHLSRDRRESTERAETELAFLKDALDKRPLERHAKQSVSDLGTSA